MSGAEPDVETRCGGSSCV